MKLRQPTMAESLDRLREQPAQFRDRLRLAVVLSQVLVDQFAERQRAAAPPITPHSLERPLEPLARVPLGRRTTPLNTPRATAADAIAKRPHTGLVSATPQPEYLTLLQHHDHFPSDPGSMKRSTIAVSQESRPRRRRGRTRQAVADSTAPFQLGDELFGTCPRLLADYATARADGLARVQSRRTSARQLPKREVDAFVDRLGARRTRPAERRR
jgi:hypothetical protein